MEITGKIIKVLDAQEGVSKTTGNPWKIQGYVLETQEQYPRKVQFDVFGAERIAQNSCLEDDVVKVSFDLESREFNGRWYTSVRAWKVEVVGDGTQSGAPAEQQQVASESPLDALKGALGAEQEAGDGAGGDLPF